MKFNRWSSVSVFFLLTCAFTFADGHDGAGSSGGGAAVVCRGTDHAVLSAQMLDLYEGAVRYSYVIPSSPNTPETQILSAIEKVTEPSYHKAMIREEVVRIIQSIQFLPAGVALSVPPDLGNQFGIVVPEGCGLEAAGFYETDGSLKVSRSVFQALSNTDKAAFVLHEAIYKISRERARHEDSSGSRHLNAALFSTNASTSEINSLSSEALETSAWIRERQGFHQDVAYILGNAPFAPITVRVTPLVASAHYHFNWRCVGLSEREIRYHSVPGSGALEFSLDLDGCSSLFGSVREIYSGFSEGLAYTIELINQGTTIFSVVTTQYDYTPPLKVLVLHPEQTMPSIPAIP